MLVEDAIRRAIDFVVSLIGLVLVSPVLIALAVIVKFDSPGPVFHVAERVAKGGRVFRLYKFRSMAVGSDVTGPGLTTADDPRITRVGQFLRRTKLDELPQLVNVLKGDMSLVGPRPESPHYVSLYTDAERQVLSVRPGLTGAASLAYRNESAMLSGADWDKRYVDEIMPHKLALELDYLTNRTLLSDLGLMCRTLLALLSDSSHQAKRDEEDSLRSPRSADRS
jgi:lipopolysaccharide/colanic/teichoic acid biosynthesis glycosyltransferase